MMTVFQLIKILETKDPNAIVVFIDELRGKVTDFDFCYSSVKEVHEEYNTEVFNRSLEIRGLK